VRISAVYSVLWDITRISTCICCIVPPCRRYATNDLFTECLILADLVTYACKWQNGEIKGVTGSFHLLPLGP